MHAVETERARQARLMIDVMRHVERCCVVCVEDQLQAGQHMALRDSRYPLVDPQVDRQVFGRLNAQCNHCGSCFWIKECIGGYLQKPHYSKCCASGKILLPPIRTSPEYMAMLQDRQNAKLRKTSPFVQCCIRIYVHKGPKCGLRVRTRSAYLKIARRILPLD